MLAAKLTKKYFKGLVYRIHTHFCPVFLKSLSKRSHVNLRSQTTQNAVINFLA